MHITINYSVLSGTNIALIGTKHKQHFSTIVTRHIRQKPRKKVRGAITAAINKLPPDNTLYVGLFIHYHETTKAISDRDCAIIVNQLNTKCKSGGFTKSNGNKGLVDTLSHYQNIYFYKEWFSFEQMNKKVWELSSQLIPSNIITYDGFKSLVLDDTLAV